MKEIQIDLKETKLGGFLTIPDVCDGLVIFAHGSGSSRFSPRNQFVANYLNEGNLGTLLFDLLTPQEDQVDQFTREYRFDIPLLASRLQTVTSWVKEQSELLQYNIGYFGSSTGAAAALIAASYIPDLVAAIVSRGGRPDLAKDRLIHVQAPTLLIVGGFDTEVIQLNRLAQKQMQENISHLEIIPAASHLFEEEGKLEQAAQLARRWFIKQLKQRGEG